MLTAVISVISVLTALLGLAGVASAPAEAADVCTSGTNAAGQTVYYCGVWVPSGGVPVYASTSPDSAVVDHLHNGGTSNWFFCSQSGATATASGYTSSNWARTAGDDHGAQGYVPAVYFSGSANYWSGLPACSAPTGSSSKCTPGTNRSGNAVFYCPIWVPSGGVPVYSSTSASATVVDHLNVGGSVNWFSCQQNGGAASAGGYTSSNWAKTVGDDHGAIGWVPAVYFSGSQPYWDGVAAYSSAAPPPPPPPSDGGAITPGVACGTSFNGLPALTVKLIQNACRVTNPNDEMYPYSIYAWDGGHGASPGPTYGDCSPSNGAPDDCHVKGFDCSGLVRWAYYLTTGSDALNAYTWGQWTAAQKLPHKAVISGGAGGNSTNVNNYLSQLQPGDVLWYGTNANEHVAIYLGNGKQMNAYQSGTHDGVTSVNSGSVFWGAVRFW